MSAPALTPPADEREKLLVRLQSIAYATQDIQVYEFVRPDGKPLPPFKPGAHVDVHLPNGLTRSYSLLNAGDAPDRYVIGVKHDPKSRGGSRYMHEHLRVGTAISLSPPRNHFPLDEDAAHTVLIAGGIGITPILCMAQRLERIGASWEMWYACRSQAELAFLPELTRFGGRVHLHLDEEAKTILDLAGIIAAAPAGAHFYCCGPSPMLTAYEAAAAARAPGTVHLERFGAAPAFTTAGDGFVVHLARTGIELVVPTASTLLEVLTNHGIAIDSSCQAGICGCCEVAVLEGEVDHRDEVLTASARASHKTMMACCSRAKSARLVLDL
jgi:ferredoxin-NADP reductase